MIPRKLPIANPNDHDWCHSLMAVSFGAYGDRTILVWTKRDDWETAWEHAVEWLDDHRLGGYFTTIDPADLADAARDLGVAWPSDDSAIAARVWERAETDLTPIGHTTLRNCGPGPHYVPSWEWGITELGCVDPTYTEAWERSRTILDCEDDYLASVLARGDL